MFAAGGANVDLDLAQIQRAQRIQDEVDQMDGTQSRRLGGRISGVARSIGRKRLARHGQKLLIGAEYLGKRNYTVTMLPTRVKPLMMAVELDNNEATDTELLARVQAGEAEAFAPLVSRYLLSLRAFTAMKLPVAHLADEVAHETFVFAFRNLASFDLRNSFRAWLRAIAWNLVRAELLRFAREQVNLSRFEQAQLAELSATVQAPAPSDEALFLEECQATQPAGTLRLIEQRYREGLTPDEIAAHLGRTGEWARVTLFRVRQQLRECVKIKLARATHDS